MTVEMVAFLIIAIFNILFGFLIKKFELADFLTIYNPKKDKDNKAEIEKLAGDSFFLMGIFMIFALVLGYFTNMNESHLRIIELSIMLGFVLFIVLRSRSLREGQ